MPSLEKFADAAASGSFIFGVIARVSVKYDERNERMSPPVVEIGRASCRERVYGLV